LTSPDDISETFALCGDLYKFVNLWGCDIWTISFVHFNLCKSWKLGLRRMCCRYEFIVRICLSVAKHGDCSRKLIRSEIFPFFGLKSRLNFQWIVSIFLRFSFFTTMRAPLLRIQVLRGFWRRSPLAPSALDSISPTLVTLQRIIAAIQTCCWTFILEIVDSWCNCNNTFIEIFMQLRQ
jgi:hypothetical protein